MVILLLLVAVVASVTIIASKALSTLVTESALQKKLHILNPVFFVCLLILPLTTVVQIRFLNRVFKHFVGVRFKVCRIHKHDVRT